MSDIPPPSEAWFELPAESDTELYRTVVGDASQKAGYEIVGEVEHEIYRTIGEFWPEFHVKGSKTAQAFDKIIGFSVNLILAGLIAPYGAAEKRKRSQSIDEENYDLIAPEGNSYPLHISRYDEEEDLVILERDNDIAGSRGNIDPELISGMEEAIDKAEKEALG